MIKGKSISQSLHSIKYSFHKPDSLCGRLIYTNMLDQNRYVCQIGVSVSKPHQGPLEGLHYLSHVYLIHISVLKVHHSKKEVVSLTGECGWLLHNQLHYMLS